MALDFNGTADALNLAYVAALDIPGDMTISCFIRPDVVNVAMDIFSHWRESSNVGRQFLLAMTTGAKATFSRVTNINNNDTRTATSTTSLTANTWYHLLGRSNATNFVEVFLNGVSEATSGSAVTAVTDADDVRIASSSDGFNWFNGKMCECALWDVSLDDAECVALAKGFWPALIRRDNLQAYVPIIGRFNPEPDQGKNILTVTTVGTPVNYPHNKVNRPQGFQAGHKGGAPAPDLEVPLNYGRDFCFPV